MRRRVVITGTPRGEVLAERLQRGPLPLAETVSIALGILAALSALHRRGIIHRDLRPSNVFLTPQGVKLLNFGPAWPEIERSTTRPASSTRTGILIGSPRYRAP